MLRLAIRRSVPLHPELGEVEETTFFPSSPPLRLYDEVGAPNYRNVATTAAILLERLEATLNAHMAGADQFDDITLLATRRMSVQGQV